MSFVFEKAEASPLDTFAGGTASIGALFGAARDSAIYVDNVIASQAALEKAYDDRIAAVAKATGVTLVNPMRAGWPTREELAQMQPGENLYFTRKRLFDQRLAEIQKQHPTQWEAIRAGEPLENDAKRIARAADEKLGRFTASRHDFFGKWGAILGGGLYGSLRDPFQLYALVAGGGAGAGRTIAGRILSTATKEALVNGAVEAAFEPAVQAWREKAGLDHGLGQAVRNIAMAAAFGGIVGAGGRAVGEAAGALTRRRLSGSALDEAGAMLSANPKIDETMRRALAGDVPAAADALAPIRDTQTPAVRGAIDEARILAHDEAVRPAAISAEKHDEAIAAALTADRRGEAVIAEPDPAQVQRVADLIAPRQAGRAGRDNPPSLVDFLIGEGGVKDFRGELEALGADRISRRFKGRLVKESGVELDKAREAAAQAGYLDRLYGSSDAALERSTVSDLLDLIGEEAAGKPVYRPADAERAAAAPDNGRAEAEDLVHELLQFAGPGIDDRLIARAVERAVAEDLDPFDALESVIVAADEPAAKTAVAAARTGDVPPGWSDEELVAASETRGRMPEPDPAAPEPDTVTPDETAIDPADIEAFGDMPVPDDAGNLVSIREFLDEADRGNDLAALVAACRG